MPEKVREEVVQSGSGLCYIKPWIYCADATANVIWRWHETLTGKKYKTLTARVASAASMSTQGNLDKSHEADINANPRLMRPHVFAGRYKK